MMSMNLVSAEYFIAHTHLCIYTDIILHTEISSLQTSFTRAVSSQQIINQVIMCNSVLKKYTGCTENPKRTFYEDVMCPAGRANPAGPTWCAPAAQAPHYAVPGKGVYTSTRINCPNCTHMKH